MDNLNAGAATFTPGGTSGAGGNNEDDAAGYGGDAYNGMEDTSDGAMLDEIEAAMGAEHPPPPAVASGGGGGGVGPVTYTDLPPHADEFWFPESRNCTCCNGYKHGCQCCAKEGMRSCKCAPSTGPTTRNPPPAAAPVAAASGGWQPAAPGPGTGGGRGYGGGGGGGGGGRGGGRGPQMCRFFTSPGGCRFGDSCRFSHG